LRSGARAARTRFRSRESSEIAPEVSISAFVTSFAEVTSFAAVSSSHAPRHSSGSPETGVGGSRLTRSSYWIECTWSETGLGLLMLSRTRLRAPRASCSRWITSPLGRSGDSGTMGTFCRFVCPECTLARAALVASCSERVPAAIWAARAAISAWFVCCFWTRSKKFVSAASARPSKTLGYAA
jgi:hypothetical protein